MKKITLSVFAVVASCASVFSQVMLQENFTNPFNAVASGWALANNSSALGTNPNWVQGSTNVFNAYNGAGQDYFAANYNSVAAPSGTISNWLFTPVMTIQDGAILEFATRSAAPAANIGADRLQVRFNTTGATTAIPAGPANVGPYTNMMLDINPLYSLGTTSAVSNGSVNGYPGTWVVYQLVVTGVPTPVTGRFAFRYFVENGGLQGANSNYVGIDAVKYTLPCGASLQSYTVCAGAATTLMAVGSPVTTYSWSTGATNTNSVIVTPASTSVYTVYPIANGVPCGTRETVTVTTAANLAVNIQSSLTGTNICLGDDITLTASSAANSYVWSTTQQGAVISVTPTSTGINTYTVGAAIGACFGSAQISYNVLALPNIAYSATYAGSTPTLGACQNSSFTLAATGGTLYNYIVGSNVYTNNPISFNTSTLSAGTYTLLLLGQGANGCIDGGVASFSIHPTPTISIVATPTVYCVNKTMTLTASGTGATSYTWNGTATTTAATYTMNSGATAGVKVQTVIAASAGGCTVMATKNLSVSACTGIENQFGDVATVSAFPNPFTNAVTVSGFNGRVEIFNALGQQVYATVVSETEVVNTNDFAKGVYVLKAYDQQGEEVKTFRLIKN